MERRRQSTFLTVKYPPYIEGKSIQLLPQQNKPDPGGPASVWVTKNTLKNTKAISGGKGEYLLKKYGWIEGTGLGKQRTNYSHC
jgi:hypothetical protein